MFLLNRNKFFQTWAGLRAFSLVQVMIAGALASGLAVGAIVAMKKFLEVHRLENSVRGTIREQTEAARRIEADLKDALKINGHTGNLYFNASRGEPLNSFDPAERYDEIIIYKALYPNLRGRAEVDNIAANGVAFDLHYVEDSQAPQVNEYFKQAFLNKDYVFLVSDRYRNLAVLDPNAGAHNLTPDNANCTGSMRNQEPTAKCYKVRITYPTLLGYTGTYFLANGGEAATGSTQVIAAEKIVYSVDPNNKILSRMEVDAADTILHSEIILTNVEKMEVNYRFQPTDLRAVAGGKMDDVITPTIPIRHPRDPRYFGTGNPVVIAPKAVTFSDVQALNVQFVVGLPSEFANAPVDQIPGLQKVTLTQALASGGYGPPQVVNVVGLTATTTNRFIYPGGGSDADMAIGEALDPSCAFLKKARCNPACASMFTQPYRTDPYWLGYKVTPEQANAKWWEPEAAGGPSNECKCGKARTAADVLIPDSDFIDPNTEPEKLPYWSMAAAWAQQINQSRDLTQLAGTDQNSDLASLTNLTPQRKRLDYCAKITDCAKGSSQWPSWLDAKIPICWVARNCLQPGNETSRVGGKYDFINSPSQAGYINYQLLAERIDGFGSRDGVDNDLTTLTCRNYIPSFGYAICDRYWDYLYNRSWDTVSPTINGVSKPAPWVPPGQQTNLWRNTCACEINDKVGNNFVTRHPEMIHWDVVCGVSGHKAESQIPDSRTCGNVKDAGGNWIIQDGTSGTDVQRRQRFKTKEFAQLCTCLLNASTGTGAPTNQSDPALFVDPTGTGRSGTNQFQAGGDTLGWLAMARWAYWFWQMRWSVLKFDFRLDRMRAGPMNASLIPGRASFNTAGENNLAGNALQALPIPIAYSAAQVAIEGVSHRNKSDWICGYQVGTGAWDPKCLSSVSQHITGVKTATPSGTVSIDNSEVSCSMAQIKLNGYTFSTGRCMADAYDQTIPANNFFTEPVPPNWPGILHPDCIGAVATDLQTCPSPGRIQLLVNLHDLDPALPDTPSDSQKVDLWPYRFYCHSLCGHDPTWTSPFDNQREYIRYLWKQLFIKRMKDPAYATYGANASYVGFDPWKDFVGWCSYTASASSSGTSFGGGD